MTKNEAYEALKAIGNKIEEDRSLNIYNSLAVSLEEGIADDDWAVELKLHHRDGDNPLDYRIEVAVESIDPETIEVTFEIEDKKDTILRDSFNSWMKNLEYRSVAEAISGIKNTAKEIEEGRVAKLKQVKDGLLKLLEVNFIRDIRDMAEVVSVDVEVDDDSDTHPFNPDWGANFSIRYDIEVSVEGQEGLMTFYVVGDSFDVTEASGSLRYMEQGLISTDELVLTTKISKAIQAYKNLRLEQTKKDLADKLDTILDSIKVKGIDIERGISETVTEDGKTFAQSEISSAYLTLYVELDTRNQMSYIIQDSNNDALNEVYKVLYQKHDETELYKDPKHFILIAKTMFSLVHKEAKKVLNTKKSTERLLKAAKTERLYNIKVQKDGSVVGETADSAKIKLAIKDNKIIATILIPRKLFKSTLYLTKGKVDNFLTQNSGAKLNRLGLSYSFVYRSSGEVRVMARDLFLLTTKIS
jgi:hypothetical protein